MYVTERLVFNAYWFRYFSPDVANGLKDDPINISNNFLGAEVTL